MHESGLKTTKVKLTITIVCPQYNLTMALADKWQLAQIQKWNLIQFQIILSQKSCYPFSVKHCSTDCDFWSSVHPESSILKVLTFDRLVEFSKPRTFGRTCLILHWLHQKYNFNISVKRYKKHTKLHEKFNTQNNKTQKGILQWIKICKFNQNWRPSLFYLDIYMFMVWFKMI